MKPFHSLFVLSLLCGLAHPAQSQTDAAPPPEAAVTETELSEIVVHGEAAPLTVPSIEAKREELRELPGAAEVIDAETTFKRGRATQLKDALDFAPGVFVQPRFGADESRISIRGSGLQRTFHGRGLLLLQDGVPLNLADGSFDFQSIDPLSARQVEVYRGASSLEYGGTTLGGAINFVSLTGYDAPPLGARLLFGSFGTLQAQLSSGVVAGPFDGYISLSHLWQDGFREHSRQNNQRIFANLGYRINPDLETRFYISYIQTDSELPGNLTPEQLRDDPQQAQRNATMKRFDNVDSNWKRDYIHFRLANKTTFERDDHRLTLTSFWSYKDLDHPILYVIDQESHDFGFHLRYDYTGDLLGHRNRATLGVLSTFGQLNDRRYENLLGQRGKLIADSLQRATNVNFFAQEQFYVTPELSVLVGTQVTYAKRDNEDHFTVSPTDPDNSSTQDWWGWSPKFGLLWEATETTQFYLNVSRSFEPPSFGELTAPAEGGGGLVDLRAQTATTLELGTRGRVGRFAWDLALYRSWIDDELLEYEVAPGLSQTVNADETIHQGIEAALDIDLLRHLATRPTDDPETPFDRVVLRQVYLFNDFRFYNDDSFGDNRLPGVPQHYYRAELLYEHPCGFYAGPNVEWVPQSYFVDSANTLATRPYALLGFKAGYRSPRGFSVFFEGKNLTDEHYAATTGVIHTATAFNRNQFLPGDGRGFYGGIEWRW
ncbi:MAG TPA: TonB-dependent receptor [Chthoniobacteraceae bacterium]|nr:TonB-dependent receptor [Chthoniobacteraceae bacterium]